jgi:Ca2+-binding EF-hand superfamily protein
MSLWPVRTCACTAQVQVATPAFVRYDKDMDGRLSLAEMKELVSSVWAHLQHCFRIGC